MTLVSPSALRCQAILWKEPSAAACIHDDNESVHQRSQSWWKKEGKEQKTYSSEASFIYRWFSLRFARVCDIAFLIKESEDVILLDDHRTKLVESTSSWASLTSLSRPTVLKWCSKVRYILPKVKYQDLRLSLATWSRLELLKSIQ